jgi:hypothetical protein
MLPMGSSNRRWLNQSTHSSVAYSTASNDRHGPRRWITSAPSAKLRTGFVKAVDRLGQSIVIAVANAADRWLDAGFGEAFGVSDRDVLAAAIGVMDETAAVRRSAIVERLLERIEDEAGMGRAARPPAHDAPCERVDDERDVHEPRPGRDIGKVRDPEHVGRWRAELAVDVITRAWRRSVADRRAHGLPTDDTRQGSPELVEGPIARMSRATVQRATSNPSRCRCRQTLRTP